MQNSVSSSHFVEQRFLAAEVLAKVVLHLFPNVLLVGGSVNSLGFYYDFILEKPLTKNMLELIEFHFFRYIKEEHSVHSISMMRENAEGLFNHHGHFFLARRASQERSNILELVQIDDFYGLCPSLSLTKTQEIGHAKLLEFIELIQEIEGEKVQITRILGTTQKSAKDLKKISKNYDYFLKKQDHRSLGPKLNLFSFSEQMGKLGVIWHPKGIQLQQILLTWLKKQLPENDNQISTPQAIKQEFLSKESQALEPFFFEGEEYRLRSSPLRQHLEFLSHFSLDKEQFPWQMTEYTSVYRQYPEPQWWGLFCQCSYLIDHTTICCLREQVVSELISSLHFIEQMITIFGFKAQWYLIVSRQKSPKARQEKEAIEWLKRAIQAQPCFYLLSPELQEEEEAEGPALELRIRDVLEREWPISRLSVVQHVKNISSLSAQLTEEKRVILTRRVWDSLDRLIALLIERDEGVLPFWLAPEQVRILVIGESNRTYAHHVSQLMQHKGLRVKLDVRQVKLSVRVHEAEKENVPYLVLIGEQERIKQIISVRNTERFNQNQSVDLETFLDKLSQESSCCYQNRRN